MARILRFRCPFCGEMVHFSMFGKPSRERYGLTRSGDGDPIAERVYLNGPDRRFKVKNISSGSWLHGPRWF